MHLGKGTEQRSGLFTTLKLLFKSCPLEMGRFINCMAFLPAFSLVLGRKYKYVGQQPAPRERTTEDTRAKGETPEGPFTESLLACHFVPSSGGSLILISNEGWKA